MRLVRNYTPQGQPYNPYEATFRMPQSVTKTDIRSYLHSVYGVKTTYIRTANYIAPLQQRPVRRSMVKFQRADKTYKKAVVGLVEPFYFPQAMEDMSKEERGKREKWLEEAFHIQEAKDQYALSQFMATKSSATTPLKFRWRGAPTVKRGTILKTIAERRAVRERLIAETKAKMQEGRKPMVDIVDA